MEQPAMRVCIFEDAAVADLAPAALTRPAFDLLVGAATLLERFRRLVPGAEMGVLVRPELADLCRLTHPDLAVNDLSWLRGRRVLFVNARWLPPDGPFEVPDADMAGLIGDRPAYAVASDGEAAGWPWRSAELPESLPGRPAGGGLLGYPWDLVAGNGTALEQDWRRWAAERPDTAAPTPATVLGPPERLRVAATATVEPLSVLDTRGGPVLIDDGAVVQAFSRLEGPCYVGVGSQVLAGRLRTGSVGPNCRVGGEVEASILLGHVNKYHDGFLGHSYLGEWVNVGAGTQFSDLRNDYGTVRMPAGGRTVDSGQIKIGAYVGDFTRTGIGTLLNTGTVAGPFGQLLPSGAYLPRVLPAFATVSGGRILERTDLGPMFQTAATAMGRRGRTWTETHAEFYLGLYERTEPERRRLIREAEQRRMRRLA
jgi:UDP-N-acetylglucosamine diphosphorylase / glucose-1-phosphate thymidylyltransferase / UDP-N-acetylgalactosamine diphosphorylase / glucosamine-1-phosphate N-acetyltransferase / galactosamine-1-phosphate N-acetyltransferase